MQILLVEDDPDMAEMFHWNYSQVANRMDAEASIEVITNGQKAVDNLLECYFDLIFLDIGLPVLTGFEVLQAIRPENIYTPVIMLSNSNDQRDVHKAYSLGANGYLYKGDLHRLQSSLLVICQCYFNHLILPTPLD